MNPCQSQNLKKIQKGLKFGTLCIPFKGMLQNALNLTFKKINYKTIWYKKS